MTDSMGLTLSAGDPVMYRPSYGKRVVRRKVYRTTNKGVGGFLRKLLR